MTGGRVERGVPEGRLPEVTYEKELSLRFNGEEVRLIHQPTGHTDGDTVVWFTGSKVVHMGDLFFQGGYPFVDTNSGGSILGVVAAVRRVLDLVPADTRVIPGHGEVTDTAGLREYLAMLEEVVTRVREAKGEGLSLSEILELRLTEDFDARWGTGFIKPERMVTTVFNGLD